MYKLKKEMMKFNKKYNSVNDDKIFNIILIKLSNTDVIFSKKRRVKYEIKIVSQDIYFRRLNAKDNVKFEQITKQKFISIIKYIRTLKEINTSTLKPIIGGKQSPSLAILDYCQIRL